MRLDAYIYSLGLTSSREKAKNLIKEGAILLEGSPIFTPSTSIDLSTPPQIQLLKTPKVSRAYDKLFLCIRHFDISFLDCVVLDIGASSGGFTQASLDSGAKQVLCVDVGHSQLDLELKNNQKILNFENTDIRAFRTNINIDIVVCDVSFISLRHIIDSILSFDARANILLFKPQFEVGREVKRNKKGVIMDKIAIKNSLDSFLFLLKSKNLVPQVYQSEILGKEGNAEFFIYF